MTAYTEKHFNDEAAARAYLEKLYWPEGPVCPHCGVVNHAYPTKRAGVYRCAEAECRKDFTVTMKTVMERSHIALHKWLVGFALFTASKKGFSAHQLHRTLGITYRSAWFMAMRIREAMRAGGLEPLGGEGKIVEADETYFGKTEEPRPSPQRKGRPYMQTNARWSPSLSAAVASVHSTLRSPIRKPCKASLSITFCVRAVCTLTKANFTLALARNSPAMKPCCTLPTNTLAAT